MAFPSAVNVLSAPPITLIDVRGHWEPQSLMMTLPIKSSRESPSFRNAGPAAEVALMALFNNGGAWPGRLTGKWPILCRYLRAMAGSRLDPGNYRLLAISSVVAKLFEKVIYKRIQDWSEPRRTVIGPPGGVSS
jgi:hypothetical protein